MKIWVSNLWKHALTVRCFIYVMGIDSAGSWYSWAGVSELSGEDNQCGVVVYEAFSLAVGPVLTSQSSFRRLSIGTCNALSTTCWFWMFLFSWYLKEGYISGILFLGVISANCTDCTCCVSSAISGWNCSLSGKCTVSSNWFVCHVTWLVGGPITSFDIEIWEVAKLKEKLLLFGLGISFVTVRILLFTFTWSHFIELACSILKLNTKFMLFHCLELFPICLPS